jgi:hypothetical protein
MLLRRLAIPSAIALCSFALASCSTPSSKDDAGNPPISLAWDAGEGVRFLVKEGCVAAVEQGIPIKQAIDRGQPLSRVRKLDKSPIGAPESPAFALISGASVVMTGTQERCNVGASGKMPELRAAALKAAEGWTTIALPPGMIDTTGFTADHRCRAAATGGGSILMSVVTPEVSANKSMMVTVTRTSNACTT